MTKTKFIAAAFAAVCTLAAGVAVAQTDVIKARKDGFQGNKTAMGAIKGAVEAGKPADAVKPAQEIAAWSKGLTTFFPAGSDKGDTKALPNVWTDAAGFAKAAKDTEAKAMTLAAAAQSGDLNATKAAFGELGKSCSGCHDTYRAK